MHGSLQVGCDLLLYKHARLLSLLLPFLAPDPGVHV